MMNNYINNKPQISSNTQRKFVAIVCRIVGVSFLIPAIIILFVGIMVLNNSSHLKNVCTEEVKGVIVDYDTKVTHSRTGHGRHGRGRVTTHTTYPAIIEYEVDGETYQLTSNTSTNIKPTIGKKVTIHYNPENPDEAYNGDSPTTVGGVVAICMSVVFVILGVVLLLIIPAKINKSKSPGSGYGNDDNRFDSRYE